VVTKKFHQNELFVYIDIAVIIGPGQTGGHEQTLYSRYIYEFTGILLRAGSTLAVMPENHLIS